MEIMEKFIELLPYVFYLLGSICFFVGTIIAIWKAM